MSSLGNGHDIPVEKRSWMVKYAGMICVMKNLLIQLQKVTRLPILRYQALLNQKTAMLIYGITWLKY